MGSRTVEWTGTPTPSSSNSREGERPPGWRIIAPVSAREGIRPGEKRLGANHPEHSSVVPRLSRPHRVALLALVVLCAVGVAANLHGFSLAAWHAHIDDSPAEEVLLGEARPIRSDDWGVQIPLGLAQLSHDPPHPVFNSNIGWGQNMLAPLQSPVAHGTALFRPALWGYFAGADTGLAWMWWFELVGLIGVWSCVFACRLAPPMTGTGRPVSGTEPG